MDLRKRSDDNVGWYYLDALRAVNQRGKWPDDVSVRERFILRRAGFVELFWIGGHNGRHLRLTDEARRLLGNAL
jgi:hypothetical protein